MGRRLFLKIYVAFMVVVVLCVFAAGVGSHMVRDRGPVPSHAHEVAEVFVEGLPTDEPDRSATMTERAHRLGLDLALFSEDRDVIASTGDVPSPRRLHGDHWLHSPHGAALAIQLRDGRWLVSKPDPEHAAGFPRHLLFLPLFAGLMLLGTYPVARGITRRIESLRRGVDELGDGELGTRVPVQGKDEVAALATSFNRAADRIEALVEGQRRMLASASHELRSPLARLRLSVELLGEASTAEESAAHRAEAVRNIAELDQLVEDLLLVGRLETRPEAAAGPVELLALCAEEAARVDAEVGGREAEVIGDEALLRILVRNLLENAVHHGAPPIDVEVSVDGGAARVTVTDRGPGVATADIDRLFEPFYRPENQPEGDGGGTGLGLSLVRRVADLHGGRVWCEPGVGGRFVVEIPLTRADA
jgi:two-component system, OmpR family, sensor kinase